jgi:hypothetical protein
MEINTRHRRATLLQTFFALILILMLVAMIIGYIYYGMNLAKTVDIGIAPTNQLTEPEVDDTQRVETIKDLSQESVPMDEAQKQATVEDLNTTPLFKTSESEAIRAEIILDLQQN